MAPSYCTRLLQVAPADSCVPVAPHRPSTSLCFLWIYRDRDKCFYFRSPTARVSTSNLTGQHCWDSCKIFNKSTLIFFWISFQQNCTVEVYKYNKETQFHQTNWYLCFAQVWYYYLTIVFRLMSATVVSLKICPPFDLCSFYVKFISQQM